MVSNIRLRCSLVWPYSTPWPGWPRDAFSSNPFHQLLWSVGHESLFSIASLSLVSLLLGLKFNCSIFLCKLQRKCMRYYFIWLNFVPLNPNLKMQDDHWYYDEMGFTSQSCSAWNAFLCYKQKSQLAKQSSGQRIHFHITVWSSAGTCDLLATCHIIPSWFILMNSSVPSMGGWS